MSNSWKHVSVSRLGQRAGQYWQSFSYVALVFATLFFAASVTPSLLPRTYIVQGLLSGFALAVGYGVGRGCVALWQFLELPRPGERLERNSKRVTTVIVGIVFVTFVRQMAFWQNSIRELMQMEPLQTAWPYRTALIAVATGAVLIAAARLLRLSFAWVAEKLDRFLPRRVSRLLSGSIVFFAFLFLLNDVVARSLLGAADTFFSKLDQLIDEGVEQPTDVTACGSPDSLIAWDSIGRFGKNFIVGESSTEEPADFSGHHAMQPLRVYVGLRTAQTPRRRAELALAELKRIDAFDRSLLVVANPTGTGWLDPGAVNTVEAMHAGDTAIVSIQYSYLPSWMTIIVDPNRSRDAAHALFDEIYGYWTTLPQGHRPKLYLHGLSLGALGSETSADLMTTFEDPIDGAVWSGAPFPSTHRAELTRTRNEGSLAWLPEIRDGALIRFTGQQNALQSGRRWGPIRSVYIQYASDPMVFFSPDLLLQKPDWLVGKRGPDVSPYLTWYPIVTALQIAFDLPLATSVPTGFGHNYSPANYIDAWVAVTNPPDWTDARTERLKELFRRGDAIDLARRKP